MNIALIIAAGLSLATAGIHVFMGGPEIHTPVKSTNLPEDQRAIWSVLWHFVSWIFVLFGGVLAWLGITGFAAPVALALIAATLLGFTILFLWYGWVRLGSFVRLPQWTLFAAILCAMGFGVQL